MELRYETWRSEKHSHSTQTPLLFWRKKKRDSGDLFTVISSFFLIALLTGNENDRYMLKCIHVYMVISFIPYPYSVHSTSSSTLYIVRVYLFTIRFGADLIATEPKNVITSFLSYSDLNLIQILRIDVKQAAFLGI